MRSLGGTKAAPSLVTSATNLTMDCLAEPSFHDASGSCCAAAGAAPSSSAATSLHRFLLGICLILLRLARLAAAARQVTLFLPRSRRRLDFGATPGWPILEERPAPADPLQASEDETTRMDNSGRNDVRKRVLAVDDDPSIRHMLERVLSRTYDLVLAADG